MAREWRRIPLEEAKQHPLYGVKNWLAVLGLMVIGGCLKDVSSLTSGAYAAGMTPLELLNLLAPIDSSLFKIHFGVQLTAFTVFVWMLIKKHPKFRQITTLGLLVTWPLLFLLWAARGLGEDSGPWVLGTFNWVLGCAVWIPYLQLSRRVRVTFEQSIAVPAPTPVGNVPPAAAEGTGTRSIDDPVPAPGALAPATNASAPVAAAATPVAAAATPVAAFATRVEAATASVAPATSHAASAHAAAVEPSEEHWAAALAEVESEARRPGLWAQVFSHAGGDETAAKAAYLKLRAVQLAADQIRQQEEHSRALLAQQHDEVRAAQDAQKRQAAEKAAQDLLREQVRARAHTLASAFSSGKRLSDDEIRLLASVSDQDPSVATVTDRQRGDSLLHWCARYGLLEEARTLVRNGAHPDAPNGSGSRPYDVAQGDELRASFKALGASAA